VAEADPRVTIHPAALASRGSEMLEEQRGVHERVVARDRRALLEALDRNGHMVFCCALALSGQSAIAADLTEAVFVQYWRTPEAFPPTRGPLGLQMIRQLLEHIEIRPRASETFADHGA